MSVVEVTLRQGDDLTVDDIHRVIVEILECIRPRGCLTCGLLGVDLVLRGGDPEVFDQIAQVSANPKVLSVSQVNRGGIAPE
ncbi:MAG: hypothetical protein ABSF84_13340 [Acidimicrobiales bacterium]|jgi:hypothetical protein